MADPKDRDEFINDITGNIADYFEDTIEWNKLGETGAEEEDEPEEENDTEQEETVEEEEEETEPTDELSALKAQIDSLKRKLREMEEENEELQEQLENVLTSAGLTQSLQQQQQQAQAVQQTAEMIEETLPDDIFQLSPAKLAEIVEKRVRQQIEQELPKKVLEDPAVQAAVQQLVVDTAEMIVARRELDDLIAEIGEDEFERYKDTMYLVAQANPDWRAKQVYQAAKMLQDLPEKQKELQELEKKYKQQMTSKKPKQPAKETLEKTESGSIQDRIARVVDSVLEERRK